MEVPAERVSMRKTHEVLRLHFDLKLKQRQIARSANLSQSTVHEYLRRFTAAGLSWPLPEQMSEAELEAALFSADAKPPRAPARYLPDFSHIHKEIQEHKHVTLQLLCDHCPPNALSWRQSGQPPRSTSTTIFSSTTASTACLIN
jgi:hypothetical protein